MSPELHFKRRLRLALIAAIAVIALWLLGGVRRLDPSTEFGVVDALWGDPRRVGGSWALAPPGLGRLTRYPRFGVELPLPAAEQAQLPARGGSRFGYRGTVMLRVRPESWWSLHRAADGEGLPGALLTAVREASAGIDVDAGRDTVHPLVATRLEQSLREALGKIGLELRGLELGGFDFLAGEPDAVAPPDERHLLIVGLDGADWSIIDPLIAQGRLPNLAGLIEHGVRSKLLTISPMLSPVIWTSVATGVEPSRHGIIDFLVADAEGGSRQPVTSAQRKEPTVWEILSRSGLEVGVVGWWASWPADAVRGYLVSDRLAYQLFGFRSDPEDARGKTWPPELYEEIRPLLVPADTVPWKDVARYLDGPRQRREQYDEEEQGMLDELRTLIASGRSYRNVALELHEQYDAQLEVVYFEGTDTIGHLFMPYRPPDLPGVSPERAASFGQAVDRYYETADGFLGELLAERGDEWTVMVISDHGFSSDATRPRSTDSRIGHGGAADWHRRFGILVLSGAGIEPGAKIDEASIYDIAPTVLALFGQPVPRSWPGNVLSQALAPEWLEAHPVRFREEDPERDTQLAELGPEQDPGAAEMIRKLEALGYIAPDAAGGAASSLTARNNAGVALLAEGRYEDAEREFLAGLEVEPRAAMLRFNLGVAARLQGRDGEAERLFVETLELPGMQRMSGLMLAQMYVKRQELGRAQAVLEQVLAVEPDAAELHNLLGWVSESRGDLAAAREQYVRAAELDPDQAMPRNNLGNLAKQAGLLDEAEQWYQECIEADPYFMPAYNNLALIYQDRNELDRAHDLYQRALGKAPRNAELLNNVASWYFATGDHTQARALWERAVGADPDYPSPLNNLAGLALTLGEGERARKLLSQALALDPNYGDAHINMALVHRSAGDHAAARESLQSAASDPRSALRALLQLGFAELEQGFVDEAIQALSRARDVQPRHPRVWSGLGEAYRVKGQTEQAIEAWRRSLQLNPNQAQLRRSLEILEQG